MSMMSYVMPGNVSRVRSLFPPFPVELNDRYLSIRTFNEQEPVIHCLNVLSDRAKDGVVYGNGLYIYAADRRIRERNDVEPLPALWYHKLDTLDDADGLLCILNVRNVFSPGVMESFGFVRPPQPV